MRIKLTDICREYGFDPDDLFSFAKKRDTYAIAGKTVEDASIPAVIKRHLTWDFRQAQKKGLVSESLEEFLNNRILS